MSNSQALCDRLDAEAGLALARLERGFRLLDTVAQLAPLLGLFRTVLGMTEAFQKICNLPTHRWTRPCWHVESGLLWSA
ncbi:MotA/TolQ/ExbB proton channel family protein [uncultured Shimia sp.]|uniref:MotA/TolQ/ExbB proton channel family protein n=1 Tax=uncultured Shimia sp. TaxID=573152 RepID=UPI002604B8FE|nr:MotA/TolQ/ExbB proton channel family protein [uncultured Shimia sp.]